MKNTTIAIDLAKSVFEVGISNQPGRLSKRHRLSRKELARFIAEQPSSTVLMEACSSSHYWARKFIGFGHEVKLLPPAAVRPYVVRSKTDATDVKGILEASRNGDIYAVPIKSETQQQITSLHRIRSRWVATRTMRINSVRGLLREFGMVFPTGAARVGRHVGALIADAESPLPILLRGLLEEMLLEIAELEGRIRTVERHLEALASESAVVGQLRTIPGIGLLTATALVAFIGDITRFPSSRHFASYLGLTPKEHSSGSRRWLGRITKQGDVYLRTLLIHGARAVLRSAKLKSHPIPFFRWALELQARCGHNKAAVAVANKIARMVWAVWRFNKPFASSTSVMSAD